MILRYVFTFMIFAFLINCAGNNDKNNDLSDQIQFSPPEKQYTEAMLKFDNQQYDLATLLCPLTDLGIAINYQLHIKAL